MKKPPIERYGHILCADDTELTVKLSKEEQAMVLAIYDDGLGAVDSEEKREAVYRLVAKLKDEIWP